MKIAKAYFFISLGMFIGAGIYSWVDYLCN